MAPFREVRFESVLKLSVLSVLHVRFVRFDSPFCPFGCSHPFRFSLTVLPFYRFVRFRFAVLPFRFAVSPFPFGPFCKIPF